MMKSLGAAVTVFALLLPAPAKAQAVKPEDLAGTWMRFDPGVDDSVKNVYTWIKKRWGPFASIPTLVLQSDSTFRWGTSGDFTHWNYLRGDTISFTKGDPSLCAGAQKQDNNAIVDVTAQPQKEEDKPGCKDSMNQITLKGRNLTFTTIGKTNTGYEGTYVRVEIPKPKP